VPCFIACSKSVQALSADGMKNVHSAQAGKLEIEQREGRRLLPKEQQRFLPVLRTSNLEPHEPEPIREQL